MAINYTYPEQTNPTRDDEFLIIDNTDNITRRASIDSVLKLGTGTDVGISSITTTNGAFVNLTSTTSSNGTATLTGDLSALGTKDSTTFLRGDNTWSTVPSALTATIPIVITGNVITLSTVPVAKGGTNIDSYTLGDILYASTTGIISKRAIGIAGDLLTVSGGLPVWSSASFVSLAGGTMTGDLVMGSNKVTSSADPASADTLTRKAYVDEGDALKLNLSGGAMAGPITTNSTFDGRDVAADGVTADAALPKAGGTMAGAILGVTTLGVDLIEKTTQTLSVSAGNAIFTVDGGSAAIIDIGTGGSSVASFSIINMASGMEATLIVNNTDGSGAIGSYASNIKWPGGTAPTISVSGNPDIITFKMFGSNIYASIIQNYS